MGRFDGKKFITAFRNFQQHCDEAFAHYQPIVDDYCSRVASKEEIEQCLEAIDRFPTVKMLRLCQRICEKYQDIYPAATAEYQKMLEEEEIQKMLREETQENRKTKEERMKQPTENQGEIIIYQTEDGNTKLDVRVVEETVWLTQAQLVELYQSSKANISEHIKNIYEEGELDESATVRKFRTVQNEGERDVARMLTYYNLDMIISLGYRVKSLVATQFRRWATARLKEYIIKGFTMDDERLKGHGGGPYWKELLDRIRDKGTKEN